ncbi:MAG: HD family hydrolase [Traorella sp.]
MKPNELLEILKIASKLKTTYRHCVFEDHRQESVADHSWRIALMAMLLSDEEEFSEFDMNKVIQMCLIHDLGEAFTKDIPTFQKSTQDETYEENLYMNWVNTFPSPQKERWTSLLDEMMKKESKEAKLYKALDRLEAVISHDEADISTWLPLEYDLQLTYGKEDVKFSSYLSDLSQEIDRWTKKKIEEES